MIELKNSTSTLVAQIDPLGAGLKSLDYQGIPVVGSPGPYPGVLLFPWPNRIRDGLWYFNGNEYRLEINDTKTHSALHGLTDELSFSVISVNDSSCVLETQLPQTAGFPFEPKIRVQFEVLDSSIKVQAVISNDTDVEIPFAIGFHPWFLAPIGSRLRVNQSTYVINDERLIPRSTGSVKDLMDETDGGINLDSIELDTAFFGAVAPKTELLTDQLKIQLTQSNLAFTNVYTNRWSMPGQHWLAIEAQSSGTNSLQSGESIEVLQPGKQLEFAYEISVQDLQSSTARAQDL